MKQVNFDDIAGLQGLVSEEYGEWSNSLEVTQEMINDFADVTGDHQWIHVDVEKAKKSPFGGTIAHGFLILSLIPKVNPPKTYELLNQKSVMNYGSGGLRFLSPVPSGSTIHCRERLASVEEHKKGTLLTRELAFHVVGSEKPALLYNMQLLYMG